MGLEGSLTIWRQNQGRKGTPSGRRNSVCKDAKAHRIAAWAELPITEDGYDTGREGDSGDEPDI